MRQIVADFISGMDDTDLISANQEFVNIVKQFMMSQQEAIMFSSMLRKALADKGIQLEVLSEQELNT